MFAVKSCVQKVRACTRRTAGVLGMLFAEFHCGSLRGVTFCANGKSPKSRTGRGCFDSPSPCEPSPATTEVGLRSLFWNPPEVGAVFNIAGSYFCKDKFGAKNGGTPPPNTFRQNGRSVLPFVYFRQTQCKEIVKVNLLTNLKRKKGRKDKKTQQKR